MWEIEYTRPDLSLAYSAVARRAAAAHAYLKNGNSDAAMQELDEALKAMKQVETLQANIKSPSKP